MDKLFLDAMANKTQEQMTMQEKQRLMQEINNQLNQNTLNIQKELWTNNLESNLPIVQKSKNYLQLPALEQGEPTILVAYGPSLQKNIRYLKKTKIPIICVNKATKEVLKYNTPRFVVAVDAREVVAKSLPPKKINKDLALICPTTIHPKVLDKWAGDIYFFNVDFEWAGDGIKNKDLVRMTGMPTMQIGGNVGGAAWQMARFMGTRMTILVGYDMGYGIEYPKHLSEKQKKGFHFTQMTVAGRKVYTDLMWITYARWMIQAFGICPHITVINATEGGNLYWTEKTCNIIPMKLKSVIEGLGKID